jgi:hypothetical protein
VFKAHGVKVTDQDKVAGVTDPGKRVEIVSLIAGGMPFQPAYDSVMLPPGTSSADVAANDATNAPAVDSDAAFLDSCPIRKKVVVRIFDAQALTYRRCLAAKEQLEKVVKKCGREFKGLLTGGYYGICQTFIKRAHPRDWIVCGTCKGIGSVDKAPCTPCKGGGFLVD